MESTVVDNPNTTEAVKNQHIQNQRGFGAESEAGSSVGASNAPEIPLPSELRRILKEVARSGACSWLSWDIVTADFENGAAQKPAPAGRLLGGQSYADYRRSANSSISDSVAQAPPRKKYRNNSNKSSRRRFSAPHGVSKAASTRKRPLFLIKTQPSTFSAPSSIGSGRTSGSEPDDSTQYECDSEGTSTTTNSEISLERMRRNHQRLSSHSFQPVGKTGNDSHAPTDASTVRESQATLQEALRNAVGIVLDYFYNNRGGYKLSPAEKRRNKTLLNLERVDRADVLAADTLELSPEVVFMQRKQRLVDMLRTRTNQRNGFIAYEASEGPPFTIQRIAEVLISPERYYTQTHKLCNCLEKLFLVKSSTTAFGGSTAQNRREEREMAALAREKNRQESELRQRHARRRPMSPCDEATVDSEGNPRSSGNFARDDSKDASPKSVFSAEGKIDDAENDGLRGRGSGSSSREMLEAAARASLRTKFDHVGGGMDPHLSQDRDVRAIAENRGLTNSPPPPTLGLPGLPNHSVSGFVRQHVTDQNGDHHSIVRAPSPILFPPAEATAGIHPSAGIQSAPNMHMLQLHHAVALAGVNLGRSPPSSLDLMDGNAEGADIDVEHGRSSASNSDVDSEQSDDISFDDSASDRSDGSDSGSGSHYEPFTAARAMALNRMQQQQRLQSRVLASLNEGFRPPADYEYQSGDSIDSMRAEDSGGSDSSSQSSDIAD